MSALGTETPTAIKPSRVWYGVAAALFVVSLIPAFFLARSGMDTLDLSVDPISGSTVEVHDKQLSVFAPDHLSVSLSPIDCTVAPPGGRPIPLDPSNDVTIDAHQRVGLIPDDLPPGSYRLHCTDDGAAVPLDGFGVRSTDGWTRAILEIIAAVVIPGIAGLVAITIAVIVAVRRSSARRRAVQPPPPPYSAQGYPPPAPAP